MVAAILKQKNQTCNGTSAVLGLFCSKTYYRQLTPAARVASRPSRRHFARSASSRSCAAVVVMKKKPIHQNLNTSFVNVTALVRYLRDLQFVGSIRIELSSYEADIIFSSSTKITGREYDHIAGRISHGEQALQRILIRAKEPHGRIHVYRAGHGYAGGDEPVFIDKAIITNAREMAASRGGTVSRDGGFEFVMSGRDGENSLLLGALSDLLRIVDESLAVGKLSFPAAFRIACDRVAHAFPFMQKTNGGLAYKDGEIVLNAEVGSEEITAAVLAALRPIFKRLRQHAKYSELLRISSDRLIEVSTSRRAEFVRLGLMRHIEDLLAGE